MGSRAQRLSEKVERIRRDRAEAELVWLRRGLVDQDWMSSARRLLSESGTEESAEALRERTWTRREQEAFLRQRAELAFQLELAPARPLLAKLAGAPVALPTGTEALAAAIAGLWSEGSLEGRQHRARALGEAARELAPRLIELRGRALAAHREAERSLPLPADDAVVSGLTLPAAAGTPAPPARTSAELAAALLADTEDATREMTRWLVRPAAVSGPIPYHELLRGLRAPELDGLARPARRLARVAEGLRALGFERDLSARVRAESGDAMFEPRARVIAPAVPSNLRVVQSALDFGVLSDVYAAQGVAHALALALVSPAQPSLIRSSAELGVGGALGFAMMQLRADREYLRRIEQLEPLWVERLARHAGVIVLLEARLQAALLVEAERPARSDTERIQQLTAAIESALGAELPPGLAVLAAWSAPPGEGAFDACVTGLAAHVALRDRFDSDWFRNPRVSEVFRGAAARGASLSPAIFREELGVSAEVGAARLIELLG